MNKNFELKGEYITFLKKYLRLGHMSLCVIDDLRGYYLPHHTVFKPSSNSTKVRVVFDATRNQGGLSSNDCQLLGPVL